MMTTQQQVRDYFWETSEYSRKWNKPGRQNDYPTDIRCAFVDTVDMLARNGQISEALARRVTL